MPSGRSLYAALSLAACTRAESPSAGLAPGTTSLTLAGFTPTEMRVDVVSIAVDGEVVATVGLPGPSHEALPGATLAPGDHKIDIVVIGAYSVGPEAGDVVSTSSSQRFRVGHDGSKIDVTLDWNEGAHRLDVRYQAWSATLLGGTLPIVAPTLLTDASLDEAKKQIGLKIEAARSEHDVVKLACLTAKLGDVDRKRLGAIPGALDAAVVVWLLREANACTGKAERTQPVDETANPPPAKDDGAR